MTSLSNTNDPKPTVEEIQRPNRESDQTALFHIEPTWRDYWWGMPSFDLKDARPIKTVTINFLTRADFTRFMDRLGVKYSTITNSLWWPEQNRMNGQIEYDGPKVPSRYPICIPSKGRADCNTTARVLREMGCEFKFFVEETEADLYRERLGEARVVELPFHDLGQGSIPARNFIWEWAKEREFKRHWVLDDNIGWFARCTANRRLLCRSGALIRAIEDFTDRYENIALTGPHCQAFVPDRYPTMAPIHWNSRVYSAILIDTSLPFRWRGRYNEDTDLSIRVLKAGYCTALHRALIMFKLPTVGSKGGRALPGGNTDNVYGPDNDYRRKFAESLQKQHPDVVTITWKYSRWHHQVNYEPFRKNKPILKSTVVPTADENEYGLELVYSKRWNGWKEIEAGNQDDLLTADLGLEPEREWSSLDQGWSEKVSQQGLFGDLTGTE